MDLLFLMYASLANMHAANAEEGGNFLQFPLIFTISVFFFAARLYATEFSAVKINFVLVEKVRQIG